MAEGHWPGQRVILGHVADDQQHRAGLFGEASQKSRRFAHLCHTTRCRIDTLHIHHLNGVNHNHPWLLLSGDLHDTLGRGFRQHQQIIRHQTKAFSSSRNLLHGFFTGDVQRLHKGGDMTKCLQQHSTFTSPRMATNQHGTAGHKATTEYPIKFTRTCAKPGSLFDAHLREGLQTRCGTRKTCAAVIICTS